MLLDDSYSEVIVHIVCRLKKESYSQILIIIQNNSYTIYTIYTICEYWPVKYALQYQWLHGHAFFSVKVVM